MKEKASNEYKCRAGKLLDAKLIGENVIQE